MSKLCAGAFARENLPSKKFSKIVLLFPKTDQNQSPSLEFFLVGGDDEFVLPCVISESVNFFLRLKVNILQIVVGRVFPLEGFLGVAEKNDSAEICDDRDFFFAEWVEILNFLQNVFIIFFAGFGPHVTVFSLIFTFALVSAFHAFSMFVFFLGRFGDFFSDVGIEELNFVHILILFHG